jgi:hypothetical protein
MPTWPHRLSSLEGNTEAHRWGARAAEHSPSPVETSQPLQDVEVPLQRTLRNRRAEPRMPRPSDDESRVVQVDHASTTRPSAIRRRRAHPRARCSSRIPGSTVGQVSAPCAADRMCHRLSLSIPPVRRARALCPARFASGPETTCHSSRGLCSRGQPNSESREQSPLQMHVPV